MKSGRTVCVLAGLALLTSACANADADGAIPTAPASSASPALTSASAPPSLNPLTPTDPERVPATEAAAIEALALVASPVLPSAGHAHGHSGTGQSDSHRLGGVEQARLDADWAEAVAAVPALDSTDEAAAAGYTQASVTAPGVGVHWVKWSLIDRPFDPSAPSMLLFDTRSDPPALAGFSYWVRSDAEPAGFAGPNDTWHQHSGLCVVNGWIDREDVVGPSDCAGSYLGGRDLWMLHAWVVPGWDNRWGEFASTNPRLCPPVAGTPDLARCPDPGG